MVPAVVATLVLFCGAIFLWIEGAVGSAIFLAVYAAVVVGTIDNFLCPLLVGRDAKMPDPLTLISTLGSISYFGASGLVLGAVRTMCWHGQKWGAGSLVADVEDRDFTHDGALSRFRMESGRPFVTVT